MTPTDTLSDKPFDFLVTNDDVVLISFKGSVVKTLKGTAATRLTHKLLDAEEYVQQLLLAKATRNFKRGNERSGKKGS